MEAVRFQWIGWCKQGTSDKIWGYFTVGSDTGPFYIFWAGRGKALTFKKESDAFEVTRIRRSKENRHYLKAYTGISETKLAEIWPTFAEELEQRLSFAMLANRIKGK